MSQFFLLPEFEIEERDKPVNVASVPQRSPFRYPGGKTWFVPLFRKWIKSLQRKPEVLIEPFAGGGIISLTAAFEELANKTVMVELDKQISSVWETILGGDAKWLAKKILSFEINEETVAKELAKKPISRRELAFQTVLKNRTAHGGILAEGAGILKNGENGKGIRSRWYPQTIAKRIANIEFISSRIEFIQGDAFKQFERFQHDEHAVFFVDPPYTAGGKSAGSRLYTHSEVDHENLFSICAKLRGDFLLTYDNAEEVLALAKRYGLMAKPIAMKNTHHAEMSELLIGRDLSWMQDVSLLREDSVEYRPSALDREKNMGKAPKAKK